MIEVNIDELNYARLIVNSSNLQSLPSIVNKFDYLFVVNYNTNFLSHNFEILHKKSAVIPLNTNIDNVFKKFHSTCRNEVRRTMKDENLQLEYEIQNWQQFYHFHKKCEQERGWIPAPIEELQASRIIAVKYNDNYIAAMSCYSHDKFLRIGRIFSRRKSDEFAKVPGVMFSASSRRIVYEFCKWGINNEYNSLDLGGIDIEDDAKKGITKFKMYFGSEVHNVVIARFYTTKYKQYFHKLKNQGIDIS